MANITLAIQSAIKANNTPSKPCEDFLLVDEANQLFIVCDGVTRSQVNNIYPVPSPAYEVARIIADAFHEAFLTDADRTPEKMRHYAIIANQKVAEYNENVFTEIDYVENDLACAVAIFGMVKGNVFHYLYIGDCYGLTVLPDQSPITFTYPQTALLDAHKTEIGTGRDAIITIRRDIRNNKSHPYAYGAFTGEATALGFLESGHIALQVGQRVILSSDGLADYFSASPELLSSATPDKMIDGAEILEQAQNLRSDDKAVIVLDVR